jgi:hypothetical protein
MEISLKDLFKELDKRFGERLEALFAGIRKHKKLRKGYVADYDRERKRIEKLLTGKPTAGEVFLGLTKEEVKNDALQRVKRQNPVDHYYDQKGQIHWLRYRLAEFVCEAYLMLKTESGFKRDVILTFINEFLFTKGEDIEPESLQKIITRHGISDEIIEHIKALKDAISNPTP